MEDNKDHLGSSGGTAESLSEAARDVLAERHRQINAEGWTAQHDDEHGDGAMAVAAACYAIADQRAIQVGTVELRKLWEWTGWSVQWWKPKDRRRNLVRAAALMLAEIERLDRSVKGFKPIGGEAGDSSVKLKLPANGPESLGKAAHTPGPWAIGEYDDCLGYDCMTGGIRVGPVCLDGADYGQKWCKEIAPPALERMKADARLIAAAPELLEALQRLAKLIPVAADSKEGGNLVDYTDEEWRELVAVTPLVYAALAKATA
jgi:hypothetical protein